MSLAFEDDIERAAEKQAESIPDQAREISEEYNVEIKTDIGWGHSARQIVRQTDDFDTVIVGNHGGTFADRLFAA